MDENMPLDLHVTGFEVKDINPNMQHAELIEISLADQECFVQALISPPKPAPALERAFARRSKFLRVD
jgi:uncharacterized protein (DUF1778 family)